MYRRVFAILIASLIFQNLCCQQPDYTFKHFVTKLDTSEFKILNPKNVGVMRTYIESGAEIWDLDDANKTYIRGNQPVLLCIEGQKRNNKKEGVFSFYVIDSLDHSKRYKLWEEEYSNDKLNGQWRTYTLKGTLVKFDTFKDDSLNGISRTFWIDGKKVWDEKEYFNGSNKFIQKEFFESGRVKIEIPYENGVLTGPGKKYYESGITQEEVDFKNGKMDGIRKYYHPNGQLWIEEIYKDGKNWTVISNYTDKGQKRDAGTLKNGNGTVIYYDDDGTVWKVSKFINGEEVK